MTYSTRFAPAPAPVLPRATRDTRARVDIATLFDAPLSTQAQDPAPAQGPSLLAAQRPADVVILRPPRGVVTPVRRRAA